MTVLRARTVPVAQTSPALRRQLFAIFHRYYDEVTEARFEADFDDKDLVILLELPGPSDDVSRVKGFSTLKKIDTERDGRRVRGMFSGDTVIEKDFWGQGSLGVEFLKQLFWDMAHAPFTPFYWFLISKGYKTYLLMANNFSQHWPRHESKTPAFEAGLMHEFARRQFGSSYDEEGGVVRFENSMGQLKGGVAAVTEELCQTHPRVAFFAEKNPSWMEGDELVCLARMRWSMPFLYLVKTIAKRLGLTGRRRRRADLSSQTQGELRPAKHLAPTRSP